MCAIPLPVENETGRNNSKHYEGSDPTTDRAVPQKPLVAAQPLNSRAPNIGASAWQIYIPAYIHIVYCLGTRNIRMHICIEQLAVKEPSRAQISPYQETNCAPLPAG